MAALGMVASVRLPPCAMVTAGESRWSAVSSADEEPGTEEEPSPDGASDSEGESDAEPVPFFAWTAAVAVDEAREERGAVTVALVLAVAAPASSAVALGPTSL